MSSQSTSFAAKQHEADKDERFNKLLTAAKETLAFYDAMPVKPRFSLGVHDRLRKAVEAIEKQRP